MTAIYVMIAQLVMALLTKKIQSDTLDDAARAAVVQQVQTGMDKINAAHLQLQTGVNPSDSKTP